MAENVPTTAAAPAEKPKAKELGLGDVFGTNKQKEVDGVWMPGPAGMRFKIARAGNESFSKLSAQLLKPHRKLIRMGKMDDTLLTEISAEICARAILLDWEGVKDGGQAVQYSVAAAKERLIKYPDFADYITGLSQDVSSFQDDDSEAAAGN